MWFTLKYCVDLNFHCPALGASFILCKVSVKYNKNVLSLIWPICANSVRQLMTVDSEGQ